MLKRIVLFSIVFVILCYAVLAPYKSYTAMGLAGINTPDQTDSILQEISTLFSDFRWSNILLLIIFFPLIFIGESFFLKYPFALRLKLLFFIQGVAVLVPMYYTHFIMTFAFLEKDVMLLPPFYVVLFMEGIFALWSVLAGIPKISELKMVRFIFDQAER